ncbi:MAG: hypothetical protein VKJ09_08590, partial [Leptolyngbya sp.]|nr:hypothetical protein [Leptolyngbya sp.]
PPRVMAIFPETDMAELSASKKNAVMQKASNQKLPIPTIALKVWNSYLNEGTVRLGETRLREKGALMQRAHLRALMRSGELIPLVVKREERLRVALVEDDWQTGDRILYLLHDPKPKLLQRLSGGSRPTRLTVETLPTVEEVPMPKRVVEPKRPATNGDPAGDPSQNGQTPQPPEAGPTLPPKDGVPDGSA